MSALVFLQCDNQHELFAGIANKQVNRLQAILNASAKLIHGGTRSDHVTPLLRDKLHWLRFQQRITCKLCLTVYKALHSRSMMMGLESVSASEDVIGDLPSPWATIAVLGYSSPSYIKELVVLAPRSAATARLRSAARPNAQVTLACPRVRRNYEVRLLLCWTGNME